MTTALPLAGLVVADFSRVLAGPYASMTLGDLGADVIKIERPGTGDDTRAWGPPWVDDQSTYFRGLNRNKRSLTLDLDDDEDRSLAIELSRRADVLIENFRPGTLDKYELGFDDVQGRNDGIVYCSITGFGDSDAASALPGYDLMVQAMSGLMSITGDTGTEPYKVGVALVDQISALQATVGILAALRHREESGRGQRVSVSLMGTALASLLNHGQAFLEAGVVPRRTGNRHASIAPYQTFAAADGFLALACGNDTQFRKVCAVVGRPEMVDDPRFATNPARVLNVDALSDALAESFAQRTVDDLTAELTGEGVPAGPINDVDDAFEFARTIDLRALDDTVLPGGESFRSVASPIRFSDTPVSTRFRPPWLGEHDEEIRDWLQGSR